MKQTRGVEMSKRKYLIIQQLVMVRFCKLSYVYRTVRRSHRYACTIQRAIYTNVLGRGR